MSNRFGSGAWTRTAVTSTYGQTDADGGSTASLITESNTSTSVLYTTTAFTTAANVPYTISVKIKKGNSTWVRLAFGTSGGTFTNGVQQWYNLDTVATGTAATTGTASYISSSITATTNSYYILTLTASQASTTGAFIVSTATADASATRTTSGTYYICQAMCNSGSSALDYVSSEAHNLCLQSQTFGTSWVPDASTISSDVATAPDGTTTADANIPNAGAGSNATHQAGIATISGGVTTLSCYVKLGGLAYSYLEMTTTGGAIKRSWFNLTTGATGTLQHTSSAITSVGNGWYRCSVIYTAASSSEMIYLSLRPADGNSGHITGDGSTVGLYLWGAQLELTSSPGKYVATTAAAVYNQHFDLPVEYNTNGTVKALTREEQRTNLCLQNTALATSPWATTFITPTNNSATAPDGTTTATLLTTISTSGDCYQSITITAAAHTWSVYVKRPAANPTTYVYLNAYDGSDHRSWFNLSTGAVGTNDTGNTSKITDVGNGWYRITATRTAGGTGGYFVLGLSDADNSLTVTSGNQVYAWGAQLEAGSTESSVIVTGSAAVTRAVDDIYVATTVFPHSATEWTVYQKMTQDYLVSFAAPYSLSNETTAERHDTYLSAAGAVVARTTDGGADQASITPSGTISAATAFKFASAVKVNDFAACLNGGTVGTDVSGTVPTVYRFRLGGGQSNGSPMHGGVHESMYVPTRLADATLQTLTTA